MLRLDDKYFVGYYDAELLQGRRLCFQRNMT
jgi:hypothetical protein